MDAAARQQCMRARVTRRHGPTGLPNVSPTAQPVWPLRRRRRRRHAKPYLRRRGSPPKNRGQFGAALTARREGLLAAGQRKEVWMHPACARARGDQPVAVENLLQLRMRPASQHQTGRRTGGSGRGGSGGLGGNGSGGLDSGVRTGARDKCFAAFGRGPG